VKWPWSRSSKIVVEHRIKAPELVAALNRFADEMRYQTKVRGGIIHVREEPEERPPEEWAAWDAAHPEYEEAEKIHLRWALDVLRGVERVSEDKRLDAINLWTKAQAAGYDLPDVKVEPMNPEAVNGR